LLGININIDLDLDLDLELDLGSDLDIDGIDIGATYCCTIERPKSLTLQLFAGRRMR
jgi:hypothetical protein